MSTGGGGSQKSSSCFPDSPSAHPNWVCGGLWENLSSCRVFILSCRCENERKFSYAIFYPKPNPSLPSPSRRWTPWNGKDQYHHCDGEEDVRGEEVQGDGARVSGRGWSEGWAGAKRQQELYRRPA